MSSSEAGETAKTALEKWLIRAGGEKPPQANVRVEQTWPPSATVCKIELGVRLRFPQGTDDETIDEYVKHLGRVRDHDPTLDGNVQSLKRLASREGIQTTDEGERDKRLYTTALIAVL